MNPPNGWNSNRLKSAARTAELPTTINKGKCIQTFFMAFRFNNGVEQRRTRNAVCVSTFGTSEDYRPSNTHFSMSGAGWVLGSVFQMHALRAARPGVSSFVRNLLYDREGVILLWGDAKESLRMLLGALSTADC